MTAVIAARRAIVPNVRPLRTVRPRPSAAAGGSGAEARASAAPLTRRRSARSSDSATRCVSSSSRVASGRAATATLTAAAPGPRPARAARGGRGGAARCPRRRSSRRCRCTAGAAGCAARTRPRPGSGRQRRAQPAVGRHPAADHQRRQPFALEGPAGFAHQHVHHRRLEARADVGQRPAPAAAAGRAGRWPAPSSARRRRSPGRRAGRARAERRGPAESPVAASRSIATPPGYPSPSSLATLSKASPAASSRVAPSSSTSTGLSQRSSIVCPPDTSSARCGNGGVAALRPRGEGHAGRDPQVSGVLDEGRRQVPRQVVHADHRLAERVTQRLGHLDPDQQRAHQPRPAGDRQPIEVGEASRPASATARRSTGTTVARCCREATSGTTPPNSACTSTCEATTSERSRRPSSSTAAAVSSHDVSIPRTSMVGRKSSPSPRRAPAPIVTRPARPARHRPGGRPG